MHITALSRTSIQPSQSASNTKCLKVTIGSLQNRPYFLCVLGERGVRREKKISRDSLLCRLTKMLLQTKHNNALYLVPRTVLPFNFSLFYGILSIQLNFLSVLLRFPE